MGDQTLHAAHPDGQIITLTDYASEGAEVDLWDDPETEQGFRGGFRLCHTAEGWWYLRPLTDMERQERLGRIRRRMGLDPAHPSHERNVVRAQADA